MSETGGNIDVWMQYAAPYGGQGLNQPADLVLPQQRITLTAEVTDNSWPVGQKKVIFEVRDNNWNVVHLMENVTDSLGRTSMDYQMPWPSINPENLLGVWHVKASVNLTEVTITDEMDFQYNHLVCPWSVQTNKLEYAHLETAKITVTYGTYAEQSYAVLMTVSIYDNLSVPIGLTSVSTTIGGIGFNFYKNYSSKVNTRIPYWAYSGLATVRVNFFDKLPSQGGVAIAPEIMTTIWINPSIYTNPTADFIWEPIAPYRLQTVAFNASNSVSGWSTQFNAPTSIVSYIWNFGDSTVIYSTPDPYITHVYNQSGNFTITLTVVDSENQHDTVSQIMQVNPIVDIAVVEVTSLKSVVGQSCTIPIQVTVENQGDLAQAFNVTVYADLNKTIIGDEIAIATQNASLPNGGFATLIFDWNTTQAARGNYTISAYVTPILGEMDTVDNMMNGSWIIVALLGDISGRDNWPDGKVDIFDVALAAIAFGSYVGHPRWNPAADITGPIYGVPDKQIDIRDIALIARNFGKTDS